MMKTSIKTLLASSIFFLGLGSIVYAEEGRGLGDTQQNTIRQSGDQQDAGPYNPNARGGSSNNQNGTGSTGIGSGTQSSPSNGNSGY